MNQDFDYIGAASAPRGSPLASNFTVSLQYDKRLYEEETAASAAHARTLAKVELLSKSEESEIIEGLRKIRREIEEGRFKWRSELEDIHMNIEARLYHIVGQTAGRLHTGRSRNDQTATATRLYIMRTAAESVRRIRIAQRSLLNVAYSRLYVVMPGYTHMQRGQPVYLAHHLLAYFEMLDRDVTRFACAFDSADCLTLGSGALAGVSYPLDREFTARELGFSRTSCNSIDAVSDRDYILSFIYACAVCMGHLSRMAEELILWSTDEFGFINFSDEYSTGSSIMPQKRNPDFAELIRGKTGRVIGSLVSLVVMLKGLPLAYNRDMQEDKPPMFDAADATLASLETASGMIEGIQIDEEAMRKAAEQSNVMATDLADYLVGKGMPFRLAYVAVSKLTETARNSGRDLSQLTEEEYRGASPLLDAEVMKGGPEDSASRRDIKGGTAPGRIRFQMQAAYGRLQAASLTDPTSPSTKF